MKSLLVCIGFVILSSSLLAEGNLLWLSYGQSIKESDGSVSLPLEIKFGRYPEGKQGIAELENLKVFCFVKGRKSAEPPVVQILPLEVDGAKRFVRVRASKSSFFTVLAEAQAKSHFYSAETSFPIFGRALVPAADQFVTTAAKPSRRLTLNVEPKFDYWPQVGNPLTLKCRFDQKTLADKIVWLHDGNASAAIAKGQYTPGEDRALSWRGETAFKEIVFETQELCGEETHSATFTRMLHRSRTGNLKVTHGIVVFGGVFAASVLLFVLLRRRLDA